jgi:hypothetical protein
LSCSGTQIQFLISKKSSADPVPFIPQNVHFVNDFTEFVVSERKTYGPSSSLEAHVGNDELLSRQKGFAYDNMAFFSMLLINQEGESYESVIFPVL